MYEKCLADKELPNLFDELIKYAKSVSVLKMLTTLETVVCNAATITDENFVDTILACQESIGIIESEPNKYVAVALSLAARLTPSNVAKLAMTLGLLADGSREDWLTDDDLLETLGGVAFEVTQL